MKKILERLQSDRADSELISLIILLPLVLGILFTIIDVSIYFNDRSIVQAAARDGARTVAIMGGNGTAYKGTPIENKYGMTRSQACTGASEDIATHTAYVANATTVTECQVLQSFVNNKALISVDIQNVTCTPDVATSIGQPVDCTIYWTYGSIPGSAMGFMQMGKNNTTKAASESEVDFTGGGQVDPNSILQSRP